MSSPSDYFGWDLLYKTVQSSIKKDGDVLLALIHWFLIRNSFKCLGIGDDRTLGDNEQGEETLPEGWNDANETYTLRYLHDEQVYILHGLISENTLLINLLNVKSLNVSNATFGLENTVHARTGKIDVLVPDIQLVLHRLREELVQPVCCGTSKTQETQTSATPNAAQPRADQGVFEQRPFSVLHEPDQHYPMRDPLRDIGRGDLDPLGRGGGGMLFSPPDHRFGPIGGGRQPFNPNRINRPPGARFDPFNAPDMDGIGRAGPGPDHMRPPGFDDMFM